MAEMLPDPQTDDRSSAERTRDGLIAAALNLFGAKGYDATSVRDIAGNAGANLAAIAYHFGGKDGLRRACAQHVAGFLGQAMAAAHGAAVPAALSPDEARAEILSILRRLAGTVLTEPRADPVVRFMLRELANPSFVLDIVYSGVMEPAHRRVCALWARATGDDESREEVKIAVFAMIGQLFYLRLGKPVVLRRMGWSAYGEGEAQAILAVIERNVAASLDAHAQSLLHQRKEDRP
jgi:AcrR family transcriptional regulator